MQDLQPASREPIPTSLLIGICVSAASTAIMALWYALRPPPWPHHGLLLLAAVAGIVAVAALAGAAVTIVASRKVAADDHAHEAAEADHRARTEHELESIRNAVTTMADRQEAMMAKLTEISAQSRRMSKQHRVMQHALTDCEADIVSVKLDLDAIADSFIEHGTPADQTKRPAR